MDVVAELEDHEKRIRALEQDNAVLKAKMNLIAWLSGATLLATVTVLATVLATKLL